LHCLIVMQLGHLIDYHISILISDHLYLLSTVASSFDL
jgi:hypothetical protein